MHDHSSVLSTVNVGKGRGTVKAPKGTLSVGKSMQAFGVLYLWIGNGLGSSVIGFNGKREGKLEGREKKHLECRINTMYIFFFMFHCRLLDCCNL